jgi:hypothetical protein
MPRHKRFESRLVTSFDEPFEQFTFRRPDRCTLPK